jgi:hypothetical protein
MLWPLRVPPEQMADVTSIRGLEARSRQGMRGNLNTRAQRLERLPDAVVFSACN